MAATEQEMLAFVGLMIDYAPVFNYDVLYKGEEHERIHGQTRPFGN
jgi:hypothetical protein